MGSGGGEEEESAKYEVLTSIAVDNESHDK